MATSTIPMARGLPVVGSVFDMARDMRAFTTDSYQELGPVYGMRLLNRRFTVLAGVEANRFLARHGTKHFRSFEFWSGFNAWFGAARSTLSADGAEHAAFRRTLKRGYSQEPLMHVAPVARFGHHILSLRLGWSKGYDVHCSFAYPEPSDETTPR